MPPPPKKKETPRERLTPNERERRGEKVGLLLLLRRRRRLSHFLVRSVGMSSLGGLPPACTALPITTLKMGKRVTDGGSGLQCNGVPSMSLILLIDDDLTELLCQSRRQGIELFPPKQGGAIRQKNSRQVILLRDTADISGLDRQIF